ncbi:hypothetical protein BH11ACT3_BH11ACT3_04210 [soil metagenome]
MRRSRRWSERLRHDDGSASLEFITTGLLLLVPTIYLVITLAALQGAALAVDGAARQATRVFVQSDSVSAGEAAAARAIEITLADYGVDSGAARVDISCRPTPASCLTRQGYVTISIGVTVPLPLAPPALQLNLPAGLPVQATATEQVSRFWGSR